MNLIERLKNRYCSYCGQTRGKGHQDDCDEAARELERLSAENERLEELIKDYVDAQEHCAGMLREALSEDT